MPESMHLVVPEDLGMELIAEGFDEPFRGRDIGLVSDAVAATLTVAGTVVALGADTITLLVGTGEITALVTHIRAWVKRRHPEGAELTATVVRDGRRLEVTLKIEGALEDSDGQTVRNISEAVAGWLDN